MADNGDKQPNAEEPVTPDLCGRFGRQHWPSEKQYRMLAIIGRLAILDEITERRWDTLRLNARLEEPARPELRIGIELKRLREAAGVTEKQLAKSLRRYRFGTKLDDIKQIEKGELTVSPHLAGVIRDLINKAQLEEDPPADQQ